MAEPKSRAALYRAQAEESRAIAETMKNSAAREAVLEVAAVWDRLADQEEAIEKLTQPRSR